MANTNDQGAENLFHEYSEVFRDMDDLTLARWMVQTLGQLHGRMLRLSHPLVQAYRLAAHLGQKRQIWLKRLASVPAGYSEANCCRAPLVPIVSRDVLETGLICLHCSGPALPLEDLEAELRQPLAAWAAEYGPVHKVAHYEQNERGSDYDDVLEKAACRAEVLLAQLRTEVLASWTDRFGAVIWEDQDDCLEVLPEDVEV